MMNPVGYIRPLIGLAALGARAPGWLASRPQSPAARRRELAAMAAFTRALGIVVMQDGEPVRGGTLFIANHVSWADIPVLASTLGADFVAKAEISAWPLVGAMARRMGTIFVARDKRGHSGAQADAIRARLRQGRDVLMFAEGTTSDGTGILPFRSSLFAAADCAARVQPVALLWRDPQGRPLPPARLREVAWIDDDSLLTSVVRMARERTGAWLRFLPPIDPAAMVDRKALTRATRDAIAAASSAEFPTGYAAAPNRPE